MSYQVPVGNGCSLEDCYTNLFALADLSGLHYRKYTYRSQTPRPDPLDDPVFCSFAQCQAQGILCAWKRVPRENSDPTRPHDLNNFSRELWVFWYQNNAQEEPKNLRQAVSPDLLDTEQGSWSTSIDYNCRTILFRAIHNVIEKCLLAKGFVRLGKWFVQPLTASRNLSNGFVKQKRQFTIRLSFFLHGESTVCASVDVREHPIVLRLSARHVAAAGEKPAQKVSVILAPYGLAGELTGRIFREEDSATRRLLERWCQFYPVHQQDGLDGATACREDGLPRCVEVIVAGHRMRYPSSYVLLLERDAPSEEELLSASMASSLGRHLLGRVIRDSWVQKPGMLAEPSCQLVSLDASCECWRRRKVMQRSSSQQPSIASRSLRFRTLGTPAHRRLSRLESSANFELFGQSCRQNKAVNSLGSSTATAAGPAPSATLTHTSQQQEPIMPTLSPQAPLSQDEPLVGQIDVADATVNGSWSRFESPQPAALADLSSPKPETKLPFGTLSAVSSETPQTQSSDSDSLATHAQYLRSSQTTQLPVCNDLWRLLVSAPESQHQLKRPHLVSPIYAETTDDYCDSLAASDLLTSWCTQPDAKMAKFEMNADHLPVASNTCKAEDPYDFSAENEARLPSTTSPWKTTSTCTNAVPLRNGDNLAPIHDETSHVLLKKTLPFGCIGSFTKESDIQLTESDINNINLFDDDDDDDMLPNTTLESTEVIGMNTKMETVGSSMSSCTGSGPYSAADLQTIYPTPPSHDNPDGAEMLHSNSPVMPLSTEPLLHTLPDEDDLHQHQLKTLEVSNLSFNNTCLFTQPHQDSLCSLSWDFLQPRVSRFALGKRFSAFGATHSGLKKLQSLPLYSSLLSLQPLSVAEKFTSSTNCWPPTASSNFLRQPFTPGTAPVTPASSGYYNSFSVETSCLSQQPGSVLTPASVRTPHTPSGASFGSPATSAALLSNEEHFAETHSLFVNLLLSDSLVNLFRDHNFDSCNICICHGNAKGSEIGLYLPDPHLKASVSTTTCTCGFSAVMNKRLAVNGGLFYEDEADVTGLRESRPYRLRTSHGLSHDLLETLIKLDFSGLHTGDAGSKFTALEDPVEFADCCEAARRALDQGKQLCPSAARCLQQLDNSSQPQLQQQAAAATSFPFHLWCFAKGWTHTPANSGDVVRLLRQLRPWLQDALCDRRLEAYYQVTGPMTWKDFHKQAGRGLEESCEPQPLPRFQVEGLQIAPQAVVHWQRLGLEPLSRSKDLLYAVLAPSGLDLRDFLRELTLVYEGNRLGRCEPLTLQDVGLEDDSCKVEDEWLERLLKDGCAPHEVVVSLRRYALCCRRRLSAMLQEQPLERLLTARLPPVSTSGGFMNSTSSSAAADRQPATPDSPSADDDVEIVEIVQPMSSSTTTPFAMQQNASGSGSAQQLSLVLYLVDGLTTDSSDLHRLVVLGLLHCGQLLLSYLPPALRCRVSLQLLPFSVLLEWRQRHTSLKALAFSMYNSALRPVASYEGAIIGRSMTGFGPSSDKEREKNLKLSRLLDQAPQTLYAPAFALTPHRDYRALREALRDQLDSSRVIFCAYCLSEDQAWLLATATDERGELREQCIVNIQIPDRHRRSKASARRVGLAKMWDWLQELVSRTPTLRSRLVIQRLGRLGHGELLGWTGLLSRTHLQRQQLAPLSASLVALESQNSFRVLSDQVRLEERASSQLAMNTPHDASVTHILVFPTSAMAAKSADPASYGSDSSCLEPDGAHGLYDIDLDMEVIGMGGLDSIFDFDSGPGAIIELGSGSGGPEVAHVVIDDPQDEWEKSLMQQPLALGYYLSTAPAGPLPSWFFSSSPCDLQQTPQHSQQPVCFKASLHVQTTCATGGPGAVDSPLTATGVERHTGHPLDSCRTSDVLRYVLESYNALSWLTIDPSVGERRSCLPIHLLNLLQLYHAIRAFV